MRSEEVNSSSFLGKNYDFGRVNPVLKITVKNNVLFELRKAAIAVDDEQVLKGLCSNGSRRQES